MEGISLDAVNRAFELQQRAYQHVNEWRTSDEDYQQRNRKLLQNLLEFRHWLECADEEQRAGQLWDALFRRAEATFDLDGQELLCALLIEIYPEASEGLDEMLHAHDPEPLHITDTVRATLERLDCQYDWTDDIDFSADEQNAHFWYVSENKLEPRFGRRAEEPGADQEMPVAIARIWLRFVTRSAIQTQTRV